jgi:N-hydroxyarylamine O-acetyltransferase
MASGFDQPRFDLDAYLTRVGYSGSPTATFDTLAAIHLLHAQAIPFENLNPFLRWPVRLDQASLQQKLVRDGRGGYCFEQNLLLSHALRTIGFRVTWLAARVLWNAPADSITARSHMLLLVDLAGRSYVADVGFGGLTLTAPLRLETDLEQATPHESFRLMELGGGFVLQANVNGAWNTLYRFDLQEQFLPDYEVSSWYLSNHPASQFVTGLIAARPAVDCRYALRNTDFAVHHLNGPTERRTITSVQDMRAVLEDVFRLTLPAGAELDAGLERIATQPLAKDPLYRARAAGSSSDGRTAADQDTILYPR